MSLWRMRENWKNTALNYSEIIFGRINQTSEKFWMKLINYQRPKNKIKKGWKNPTLFYVYEIVLNSFQYHRQSLTAADAKRSQPAF